MNSIYAMEPGGKRRTFSVGEFMRNEKFLNFNFGRVEIDTIHLNERNQRSEADGYYNTIDKTVF